MQAESDTQVHQFFYAAYDKIKFHPTLQKMNEMKNYYNTRRVREEKWYPKVNSDQSKCPPVQQPKNKKESAYL